MSKQYRKKYLDYTSSEITILYQADEAAKAWQNTAPICVHNSDLLQRREKFHRLVIIIIVIISRHI